MLVSRAITLSVLNRRRSGSLQSRNEASDAELVVDDGVAVFDGLLGLDNTTGAGDVGDDDGSPSRYRRSDGPPMDA